MQATDVTIQPSIQDQPLAMTNQDFFIEKSNATVIKIATIVCQKLMGSIQQGVPAFKALVDREFKPIVDSLSNEDARTQIFAQLMLKAVNEQVYKLPGMLQGFLMLNMASGDSNLSNNFIGGIAIPHIRELQNELNERDPSIVEGVVRGSEN